MSKFHVLLKESFEYSELDDKAKFKAVSNWRNHDYFHNGDEFIESLNTFADHFHIHIRNYSLGEKGRSFVDWQLKSWAQETNDSMTGVRLWKYMLKQRMHYIQSPYKSPSDDILPIGQLRHIPEESLIDYENNCPLINMTGICTDYGLLEPVVAFMIRPGIRQTYEDLIQDSINEFIKQYTDDYEYWLSEKCIEEDIEANECRFNSDGTVYRD